MDDLELRKMVIKALEDKGELTDTAVKDVLGLKYIWDGEEVLTNPDA